MDKELSWCGYNYISMGDCVKWIRENLEYQCSKSQYSCIMSNASSWSTWRTWESTRFVASWCFQFIYYLSHGKTIICGTADSTDVNKSELQRACDTGNRYCNGDPSCIRDYIVESSPYKFCPRDFDLFVSKCCTAWNTYGGNMVESATHDCIAYCTP